MENKNLNNQINKKDNNVAKLLIPDDGGKLTL